MSSPASEVPQVGTHMLPYSVVCDVITLLRLTWRRHSGRCMTSLVGHTWRHLDTCNVHTLIGIASLILLCLCDYIICLCIFLIWSYAPASTDPMLAPSAVLELGPTFLFIRDEDEIGLRLSITALFSLLRCLRCDTNQANIGSYWSGCRLRPHTRLRYLILLWSNQIIGLWTAKIDGRNNGDYSSPKQLWWLNSILSQG